MAMVAYDADVVAICHSGNQEVLEELDAVGAVY